MKDKTQEVLEFYETSKLRYNSFLKEYLFGAVEEENETFRYFESSITEELIILDRAGGPVLVDQNHPEIIKIRKRLEFLNKL